MTVNELITYLDLMPADATVTFLRDGEELRSVALSEDGESVTLSSEGE